MSNPVLKRACRGGSIWWRKSDGLTVRVIFCRSVPGIRPTSLGAKMLAAVDVNDPRRGWVGHESDFRAQFKWVRGTPA